MELNKDKITLRGNDLELGIEYQQVVNVSDSSGPTGVLLKANTLSNILSKLNSETIDIELNDSLKCNIKSSAIDFDIYGVSLSEYPKFPDLEKDIQFQIDPSVLLDLIKHTIFSVSYDETKQFLNGIKIESKGNQCDFISTDGFRLSLKYEVLEKIFLSFLVLFHLKQ